MRIMYLSFLASFWPLRQFPIWLRQLFGAWPFTRSVSRPVAWNYHWVGPVFRVQRLIATPGFINRDWISRWTQPRGAVWTVMTPSRSPQAMRKCLPGFLCGCQTERQATCLNTKCDWMCAEEILAVCQKWQRRPRVKRLATRTRSRVTVSTFGPMTPDCESVCSYMTLLRPRWRQPLTESDPSTCLSVSFRSWKLLRHRRHELPKQLWQQRAVWVAWFHLFASAFVCWLIDANCLRFSFLPASLNSVQSINDDLSASLATADELSKEFNSLLQEVSTNNNNTHPASQVHTYFLYWNSFSLLIVLIYIRIFTSTSVILPFRLRLKTLIYHWVISPTKSLRALKFMGHYVFCLQSSTYAVKRWICRPFQQSSQRSLISQATTPHGSRVETTTTQAPLSLPAPRSLSPSTPSLAPTKTFRLPPKSPKASARCRRPKSTGRHTPRCLTLARTVTCMACSVPGSRLPAPNRGPHPCTTGRRGAPAVTWRGVPPRVPRLPPSTPHLDRPPSTPPTTCWAPTTRAPWAAGRLDRTEAPPLCLSTTPRPARCHETLCIGSVVSDSS